MSDDNHTHDQNAQGKGAGKQPSHIAYQVSKGQGGQSYFNRVGVAFPHKDGQGVDVLLHAMPVDGRVTLRTVQERLDELRQGKAQGQSKEQGQER